MPSKNSLKKYRANSYYHIYNRGVNKQVIYQDKQDYAVFLNYLKEYLSPVPKTDLKRTISVNEKDYQIKDYQCKNHNNKIILNCYCLMNNHYHILIKQKHTKDIEFFMRSLATRYTTYFNKRHQRTGPLFEGTYKAILVDSNEQLIHLSRYIHLNPHPRPLNSQPSSYSDYLNQKQTTWIDPQPILKHFKNSLEYKKFVQNKNQSALSIISKLTLDS